MSCRYLPYRFYSIFLFVRRSMYSLACLSINVFPFPWQTEMVYELLRTSTEYVLPLQISFFIFDTFYLHLSYCHVCWRSYSKFWEFCVSLTVTHLVNLFQCTFDVPSRMGTSFQLVWGANNWILQRMQNNMERYNFWPFSINSFFKAYQVIWSIFHHLRRFGWQFEKSNERW